mgnify:CR=1 FL=1
MSDKLDNNMWVASAYYAIGVLVIILALIGVVTLISPESKIEHGSALAISALLPLIGLISFQFGWQSSKEESK